VAWLSFFDPIGFSAAVDVVGAEWHSDARLGGCGGLYLYAEPGELWVEIEKSDRNRSDREIQLRVIFFGPDRTVLEEAYLPDDGQEKGSGAGPVQRIRFSTSVDRAGVYGVNITASNDRYGTEFIWGFTTNCPKYLVETSRGHKDERHQEPIVLYNGEASGEVCFRPRSGPIQIDLSGQPARAIPVTLVDGAGHPIAEAVPGVDGNVQFAIGPEHPRDAIPWRLKLPAYQGVVEIDGVTRWDKGDGRYQDLSIWTPNAESWFPLHENRWLITPYAQRRDVKPGESGTVHFELYNNSDARKNVRLSLERGATEASLSADVLTLAPGASEGVDLNFKAPQNGSDAEVHLVASTDGHTTYATLQLRARSGATLEALELPLVLRPYRHENEQFGSAPEYPVTNQVYFDHNNSPVVTSVASVVPYRDGAWHETNLETLRSTKVAFDPENDLYLLQMQGGTPALAHSRDGGATFNSYPIPGSANMDLEQFSGHNSPEGPPPFIRCTLTEKDPNHIWRRVNALDLFLPEKHADGTITIGEPVRVSEKCIGLSSHSGIPSSIVSRGNKVHVVWAEATDPAETVPGVPTFVATYDRSTNTLSQPALVGYGPPANDVHNTPSITMDSQGYLHVLVGTHGRTFLYVRSQAPNDASSGWTDPEPLGPGLRQTYVGFVCDQNDTLHVVFRLWNVDTEFFPAGTYASLSYMRKAPGKPWTKARPLVVSAFSEYSVFYHRLTIDRVGELYLSYDYWSTYWFYRTDRRETRRALMTSRDGGELWKLAGIADLVP